MAVVPVSQGATVENRPAPFVPQQAQFTPDAFGAGIGQAEQAGALSVGKVANELGTVAADMAIQQDVRTAKTSDTAHQQAVTALGFQSLPGGPDGNRGFYSLRGQAAVDALPAYQKALTDSNTQIGDSLASAPRAQNMYLNQAGMRVSAEQQRAAAFTMQQGQVADLSASTARMGAYADTLTTNYNDPTALKNFQQVTAGENQTQARLNGWDADTANENLKLSLSKGYRDAILARTQAGDVAGAAVMFKTLAPQMDAGTRVLLGQHLEPQVMGAAANAWVSAKMGTAGVAPASGISDAIRQQEGPGVSSQGANEGIMPTTFAQYAKPGESLDNPADRQAVHDRIISDLSNRAGGDPARIAVGYFSGPGNMSAPGSPTPWKVDKHDADGSSTSGYVNAVLSRLPGATPATAPAGNATDANLAAYPAFDKMYADATDQFKDDPRQLQMVISRISASKSQYDLQNQSMRDGLEKSAKDTTAALMAGNDTAAIPYAQIRHSFRPGVAEPMIAGMEEAKTAGQIYSGMQFASPQQIAASRDDLAQGLGPLAAITRLRGGAVVAPPTDGAPVTSGDVAGFAQRQHDLALFDSMNAKRQAEITKDPAAYVGQEPGIAAAFKAVDPHDPATLQAAIAQSQSVQRQVGVAPGDERTVSNAQAAAYVKALHGTTPEKGDMGQQLDQLEKQYGPAYGGLVADLTRAGLSPQYQMLAHANAPEQATVRSDLQRALQLRDSLGKDKGEFGASVPAAEKPLIDPAIDSALAPYQRTIAASSNGSGIYDTVVYPAVKTLATYYASQGTPAQDAVDRASKLVTASYAFDGSLRVPTAPGMPTANQVRSSASTLLNNMTDAGLKDTTAAEARAGTWFTNPDDKGATLMKGTLQGGYLPVRKADGGYLSLDFSKLPTAGPGPQAGLNYSPGVN